MTQWSFYNNLNVWVPNNMRGRYGWSENSFSRILVRAVKRNLVKRPDSKFLIFSDFWFVPKRFTLMTILTTTHHSLAWKDFLMFLPSTYSRFDFYKTDSVNPTFFGVKVPPKIFEDSHTIFFFFKNVRERSPWKIFRFF